MRKEELMKTEIETEVEVLHAAEEDYIVEIGVMLTGCGASSDAVDDADADVESKAGCETVT